MQAHKERRQQHKRNKTSILLIIIGGQGKGWRVGGTTADFFFCLTPTQQNNTGFDALVRKVMLAVGDPGLLRSRKAAGETLPLLFEDQVKMRLPEISVKSRFTIFGK